MPWANGINYSNVSSIDLNFDGKKDIVVFDRSNNNGTGFFRCFINVGNAGETKYKHDPFLTYYFPPCRDWAVLLDYDGDGKEDLFTSVSSLGMKVYKNTSTPQNILNFTLVSDLVYSDYDPTSGVDSSNLFISSIGVPGIADVDNDGDLDVLTFSSGGAFIQYHKNLSMETYGDKSALKFEYADNCWGKLAESFCMVDLNYCSTNSMSVQTSNNQAKIYHAGSCLTCLDSDGDQDQDIILGDISCNIMQYIHNGGNSSSALFTDTTKLFPSAMEQIKMSSFPCTYYVDVNDDGKKDLIATPNVATAENFQSLWFYENVSATNTVNFQFRKKNFLQDEMIEVGQNSFPVLFDYNADGKKDLLIGTYGYYINNSLRASLTLYENIGTSTQPTFSLITRDFANLASQNLSFALPAVGDIDNDGDVDICVGTSNGRIHWLEKTANGTFVFHNNPFNIVTSSAVAAPQLFDLDKDGKLDLLIGTQNGRISFYKNISTNSTPSFSLITNFLGNVDVKGDILVYGLYGYATPYFFNEGSETKLLVGSVDGRIFYYDVPNINSPFILISDKLNNYNEGVQTTVWYEDIDDDNKRDLFMGNASGGLSFFSAKSNLVGISKEPDNYPSLRIYPNPVSEMLHVELKLLNEKAEILIYDILGREVIQHSTFNSFNSIDVSGLEKGIYFITMNTLSFSVTKKFVKN